MRRAFVVVLDACGAGPLPDSAAYGDPGANTLGHLAAVTGGLRVPTLARLGLGSILPLDGVPPAERPVVHGQLSPLGVGKDSTAGHWELMGAVQHVSPPTYPNGFPPEVLDVVISAGHRPVICNRVCNGIGAIDDYGAEQLRSGALIVYTSQDSVLQIAAHERVAGADELHAICRLVRERLAPEHAVGRVIARPFTGEPGAFRRTDGRHDYALPPSHSYLNELQDAGVPVHTVGKVGQLFAGFGIDAQHPGATNAAALAETTRLMTELEHGFVFTNLIETDQVYGHRHDAAGFHGALQEIDRVLAGWLERLRAGDLLVLTADHGCDVTMPHTEHTRECVPLLAVFPGTGGRRHDGPLADVGASVLAWLADGAVAPSLPGRSFVPGARAGAAGGGRMPELPEVETIRRQLAPHVEGRRIESVEILDERWTRPYPPEIVAGGLTGAVVERVSRAGKYLIWQLSGELFLLVHLRMTGALLFDPPVEPAHTRARFVLSAGHRLVYVDPRRFGTAHLLAGQDALVAYLAERLGPEPFTPAFTAVYLRQAARGRVVPVKAFVLDQRRIAGVGNIYADEALFRAGIHPLRPAGRLTGAQWARLRDAIEEALGAGIDAKGASIDDFRHVDGARGSFQDRFYIHLRAGEPCLVCGRAVRKIVVGGRGTYVCEHCQPRPRARASRRAAAAAARAPARPPAEARGQRS